STGVVVPGVTITVATPDSVPLVACTVPLNVPAVAPAVKFPLELMLPPPFTTDQTGVIGVTLPPTSLPTAVNCCVPLIRTDPGVGDTVIVAGAPAVTVTVPAPETPPTVATIEFVNVPTVLPAVKSPVAALMVPPPATTDQTGVIVTMTPLASRPTAVNCSVCPTGTDPELDVIVIVATGPPLT